MEENNNAANFQPEQTKPANNLVKKILPVFLIVLVVSLGIFSGYQASLRVKGSSTTKMLSSGEVSKDEISAGKEFGMKDPGKADSTIGVIEKGGLNGEGTHKLLREGGPSQTVYMTSSVLDLDQFVGQKVQVWGETNKAQKAGWLMDVIKLKVLD